jgi:HEAT repeat protein
MPVQTTFEAVAKWPPQAAIPFCEAALTEHHLEVQLPAYDLLIAPHLLNRPDVVVLHFDTLLPEIRERVAGMSSVFFEIARKQIRSGNETARRSAYEMLGELGGVDSLKLLSAGLEDPSNLIRDRVARHIEKIALNYHYHLLNWLARKDPASREFVTRNRTPMLDALDGLLKTWPFHKKDVAISVAIETGGEAYKLITGVVLNRVDSPLWKAFLKAMQGSNSTAMVDILFRLYFEGQSKYRDVALTLMHLRKDPEFAAAIAEYFWRPPADRMKSLRELKELPFWGAVEANPDLPAASALVLLDFVADAPIQPKERDAAIKSFLKNSHPEVRIHVLKTFRRLNYPYTAEIARGCLGDPSDDVKFAGAQMVAELVPTNKGRLLMPLLDSRHEATRKFVMGHIAHLSVGRYLAAFAEQDSPVRLLADKVASRIDEATLEQISEEIVHLDPIQRMRALKMCEPGDSAQELKPLIKQVLADEQSALRPLLVQLLAFTGNRAGLRHILELLASADLPTRQLVVEALQDLHDMRYGALFLPFVADRDPEIRQAAGQTVFTFGQAEARLLLPPLLSLRDERLASAAAQAIALTKIEGGREVLEKRLEIESRANVRNVLIEAISAWA